MEKKKKEQSAGMPLQTIHLSAKGGGLVLALARAKKRTYAHVLFLTKKTQAVDEWAVPLSEKGIGRHRAGKGAASFIITTFRKSWTGAETMKTSVWLSKKNRGGTGVRKRRRRAQL